MVTHDRCVWMLLSYRIPREPSTPRIAVWRKLRHLGVAQIGDGLAALPADARTQEQLEWLAEEIAEAGGASTLWRAELTSAGQEQAIVGEMTAARSAEYADIAVRARALRLNGTTPAQGGAVAAVAASGAAPGPATRLLSPGREGHGAGRGRRPGPEPARRRPAHRDRTGAPDVVPCFPERARRGGLVRWTTRAGIHVDRASSAWLIGRFIDPDAEFAFVTGPGAVPAGAVPFDMRGVEFGHHGQDCTFETLLRRHDLDDPVLWRIAG